MPVDRIIPAGDTIWGLWNIQEDEQALAKEVPGDILSPTITNPRKKLEFFAGRNLVRLLLAQWKLPYPGLVKDRYGKPFLPNSDIHVSLSHSYPFVAAILHRHKPVGIDLEQPKDKLLRIAPRILAEAELRDAGDNIVKHCVYWCAKETLVKIYGKKDLIFSSHLLVEPFPFDEKGTLTGRILAQNKETAIPLEYIVSENFVVVVSK